MSVVTSSLENILDESDTVRCQEEELSNPDEYSSSHVCVCCNSDNPKYKCPKCRLKYCSVLCCQCHKTNGTCCGNPTKTITKKFSSIQLSTGFENMVNCYDKLGLCLKSNNLREWIKKLDSCSFSEASHLYEEAMEDREFLEFAQLIDKIRNNNSPTSDSDLDH